MSEKMVSDICSALILIAMIAAYAYIMGKDE